MIETAPRPDASLSDLLAARARRSSDTRLALDTLIGLIAAVLAVVWRGPAWYLLASLAACFLAFGAWGIADRELGERGTSASRAVAITLRTVRIAAVVLGAVAIFVVLASALGVALGTMIS